MSDPTLETVADKGTEPRRRLSLWKARVPLVLLLIFLVPCAWYIYSRVQRLEAAQKRIQELEVDQKRTTGRLLVDQVMIIKHWEAMEDLELDDDSGQLTELRSSGKYLDLIQNLTKRLSKQEYVPEFIRPDDTEKVRDEFERKLLKRFTEADPKQAADWQTAEFAERSSPERGEYQYYQSIRAEESCLLVCHRRRLGGVGIGFGSAPGLALGGVTAEAPGELMAVVKITIAD